ncbi:Cu(I)-responsive transcriptional regulator [Jannaschia seohaensis]|uniref:Cu(I)-responsive transcriptional regulator n=1 Tax=Jannaschia seohaensis TaxID=475081 RepID=A0A2Y9A767_9RHOB|nr:Cu(I)-responsive transcriptional regulator [Jannaschia seohaensis]PWJ21739.1 Cu(I)-responsive transcriptional regulator [Jannaschia seohaensis]SSA38017.1 Cu(I)-responsive transcriptional regulator [Jannaschia seohaensis]
MNISDASARTGVPAKTIRYYEEIDLVRPKRSANGYRSFSDADIHKLNFVGRARSLGFPIEQCRTLLALWDDEARSSAEVKAIAEAQLGEIDARIADLREMRETLAHLIGACAGDQRPDCPILESLGGEIASG